MVEVLKSGTYPRHD